VIQGNLIGTDKTGSLPLPNGPGVVMGNSADNMIGGTITGARNVISGNSSDGVQIIGASSTGNNLQGNYLGTNTSGTAAIGNDNNGITVSDNAANNTIGGTTVGASNVISGNKFEGILFTLGSSNCLAQGNYYRHERGGLGRDWEWTERCEDHWITERHSLAEHHLRER
jgi:titin